LDEKSDPLGTNIYSKTRNGVSLSTLAFLSWLWNSLDEKLFGWAPNFSLA
jgi:hypothetical protein